MFAFSRLCVVLTFALGVALPARAALPDSYRQAWSDPAVVGRINEGIERHRKKDATIEVRAADGQPAPHAAIEIRQQTHEFLFGCNAFVLGQLDSPEKNRKYEEAFVRLFNFATVPFYWEGTEPAQGELRYAEGGRDIWRRPPPDRFLAFAKQNGITLKGHPLLWHAYNPPWLPKDADALQRLYQKRFAEIAARYAAEIPIWDVVNESLVCAKTYPLYSADRAYVAWAFREAAKVFRPDNRLMINEVNLSNLSVGQASPYYRQVKQLLADGVGVKGIGFQFHFFNAQALSRYLSDPPYAPGALLDVYRSFADFQLPLYVTEITIPTVGDDGPAVQAEIISNLYRLWFSSPRMAGITWWNLGDGTAVKGENQARGGLLDEQLEPKDSYRALDRLINHQWKTRLEAKTDAQGQARFRGFCGRYTVKVTTGNTTRQFKIDLSKDGPALHKLILTP